MKYFHSSPAVNLPAILHEGLRPMTDFGKGFELYVHDETLGYNDFIADLLEAEWVVCFEVNVEGITLHTGPDGEGTYAIHETIPPDRLKVLGFQKAVTGEWVPMPGNEE